MIIYNSKKEFIGIDKPDLKALGFSSLYELKAQADDFADLFVKTPGHIHNFNEIHWIDFVRLAKSTQDSKAIIHVNNKNFKVNLEVKAIFLSDSPNSEAYIIELNNLRGLSSDESTDISSDVQNRTAPTVSKNEIVEIVDDPYADEEIIQEVEPIVEEEVEVETIQNNSGGQNAIANLEEKDFVFDPQRTAEILEMSPSLIEEFIQDFIAQANKFKPLMYASVENNNLDELKSYSHQLKGVAANLRVNHALEILSIINKSASANASKDDLDTFYAIISNLQNQKMDFTNKADTPDEEEAISIDFDDEDDLIEIAEDEDDINELDDLGDLELDDVEEIEDDIDISDDFDMLDDAVNELIHESEKDEIQEDANYDKEDAAKSIGIDQSSYDELFQDYKTESSVLTQSIQEAINNNESELWKSKAIKLKGMSDNMRIQKIIIHLETLIHTDDSTKAQDALENAKDILTTLTGLKD